MLLVVYVPDADLGAQLVTTFFGACVISAYIISTLWKRKAHSILLTYLGAVLILHFAMWILAYHFSGRTGAYIAGAALTVEIAFFSWLAEKFMPDKQSFSRKG